MVCLIPKSERNKKLEARKQYITDFFVLKDEWSNKYEYRYTFTLFEADAGYISLHNIVQYFFKNIENSVFFLFDHSTMLFDIEKQILINSFCCSEDDISLDENIFYYETKDDNKSKAFLIDLIYKSVLFEASIYISFSPKLYFWISDERVFHFYFKNQDDYEEAMNFFNVLKNKSNELLYY